MNRGRGSCFLLKISFQQKCSVFSGFSLTLCGFDPQTLSEGKKKKVWPNFQVHLLVRDTGWGRVRGDRWDAVVKRAIATSGCARERWQSTRSDEEPGPEQLCAGLRSALL